MEKLNLPDGWEEGANPFVSGGATARANLTWQKTVRGEAKFPPGAVTIEAMYEVRYAFDPDGYRAFKARRTSGASPHRGSGSQQSWAWQPVPNCPTFADPVACMVWLEIERWQT